MLQQRRVCSTDITGIKALQLGREPCQGDSPRSSLRQHLHGWTGGISQSMLCTDAAAWTMSAARQGIAHRPLQLWLKLPAACCLLLQVLLLLPAGADWALLLLLQVLTERRRRCCCCCDCCLFAVFHRSPALLLRQLPTRTDQLPACLVGAAKFCRTPP